MAKSGAQLVSRRRRVAAPAETPATTRCRIKPDDPRLVPRYRINEAFVRADLERSQKLIVQAWVHFCGAQYRRTGNPLFLWRAYSNLRALGEPLPAWMLEYFDRIARELLAMNADRRGQKIADGTQRLAETFMGTRRTGRGGVGRVFDQFDNEIRDYDLAQEVHELVVDGLPQDRAINQVVDARRRLNAEGGSSEAVARPTVRRAYEKHRAGFT